MKMGCIITEKNADAELKNVTLHNPILPGFYPDPSICRRGDDLYLVTSSFEYFPGVPIFHSRDMAHWQPIGHCLSRPEQLPLDGVPPSCGIYAPTLRYHETEKRFYMITTLVRDRIYAHNVNFYVTAEDPAGPWSDPIIVEGAEGIDPTLFFDGEQAYYLGNMRPRPEEPDCTDRWIWLQPIDLDTGKLTGEKTILLRDGAFRGAATPEGPHLYHIGGWYYLMIAEGGTAWNHAETVFRSRHLTGPWEADPRNPLITHRHLGRQAQVDSTGHADLLQLANGEWWAVLLARRSWKGEGHPLGREAFALPVTWEDGWPVFSPDTGRVEAAYPAPKVSPYPFPPIPEKDDFQQRTLAPCWNTLRTPRSTWWSLLDRPGWLRLYLQQTKLTDGGNPALLIRRQQHMCFRAETRMDFSPRDGDAAGMILMMNETHYVSLLRRKNEICVYVQHEACGEIIGALRCAHSEVLLRIERYGMQVSFSVSFGADVWHSICNSLSGAFLSVESAGGFTGPYVGLYAFSIGSHEPSWADFDWFTYQGLENAL